MSRCFTWFPIIGLGEPNIYHQSVCFTNIREGCEEEQSFWKLNIQWVFGTDSPFTI
jgi:hypothetical protein